MNVVAVIPTYNSVELVSKRISELKRSLFSHIIVCDDNSRDNTKIKVEELYGDSVEVLAGEHNIGPGGNRNRVIKSSTAQDSDVLFFLDADCEITYEDDVVKLISSSFRSKNTGVVGFSLMNAAGELMRWNYGELMHPVHEAADQKLDELWTAGVINQEQFSEWAPARAASYRMLPEQNIKEVGWVAEGCFAISTKLFTNIGGFAEQMRYHEAHDLNARIQEAGYKTLFNPEVVAKHLEYDSRFNRRDADFRNGRLYYYKTHWGMDEHVFSILFDEMSALR